MKNFKRIGNLVLLLIIVACNKDDGPTPPAPSSAKEILGFSFKAADNAALRIDVLGTLDQNKKRISAVVPFGTDISDLRPSIDISPKASVLPEGPQDFSQDLSYTVTAEDGSKADYVAMIAFAPSDEKQLISFKFLAANNDALNEDISCLVNEEAKTVSALLPKGTDLTALNPTIEVSAGASVSPDGPQDFSPQVQYTVMAQDSTRVSYTASIAIPLTQREVLIAIYKANPGNSLTWKIDDPNSDIGTWEGVSLDGNGNVQNLQIANKGLTVLPSEAGQLTALEFLTLNGNEIDFLPPEIGNLQKLIRLTASDTHLSSVPQQIKEMTNLKDLILTNNKFVSFPMEATEISTLDKLDLSNNQISSLPPEIAKLESLLRLRLNNNLLTELPSELGNIFFLIDLELNQNALETVPTELGQLQHLNALFLKNNSLTEIPFEVCKLKTERNTIIELDDGVGCGVNPEREVLRAIYHANPGNSLTWDLDEPDLEQWDGVFTNSLGEIDELDISAEDISAIPAEIGQLTNLKRLYLSHNSITSLPNEIGELIFLEELELNHNLLNSVPQSIENLWHLKELYLNNNTLSEVPNAVMNLTLLKKLDLAANNITIVPSEISQMIGLDFLGLNANSIHSIPDEIGQLGNLKTLRLFNNNLTEVPLQIGLLHNLISLRLEDNDLNSYPVGIDARMVALQILDLRNNSIDSIPSAVRNIESLRVLNLAGNGLSSLPFPLCIKDDSRGGDIAIDVVPDEIQCTLTN